MTIRPFLFAIFPMVRFEIFGKSMSPAFSEGQKVIVRKKWFFCSYKKGDIIVFKDPRKRQILIKRIRRISRHSGLSRIRSWMHFVYQDDKSYFVLGDNLKHSTDSRRFGWINKKDTIGKVIA